MVCLLNPLFYQWGPDMYAGIIQGTEYATCIIEGPLVENTMTEDAEEYSPLWWKLRWYNDDKFENELIEAIRAKDKPSTGAVYRLSLIHI